MTAAPEVLEASPHLAAAGRLVLGGNVLGGKADEATSHAVLDAYVDAGGRAVDSADVYSAWLPGNPGGDSERVLGSWLASRGADRLSVATKGGMYGELQGTSPDVLRRALTGSLERLGLEAVDLYYAHRDDEDVPLDEALGGLSTFVDEGLTHGYGLSNFTADRLAEALRVCDRHGYHRPVAVQEKYNLVRRGLEADVLPLVHREGIGLLPYSSLHAGFLTGKYRPGQVGDEPSGPAKEATRPLGQAVLAALDEVAAAHAVTPTAVACAWLAAQDGVVAALASARDLDQARDLLPALHLELASDEVAALEQASRR